MLSPLEQSPYRSQLNIRKFFDGKYLRWPSRVQQGVRAKPWCQPGRRRSPASPRPACRGLEGVEANGSHDRRTGDRENLFPEHLPAAVPDVAPIE